jgi:hypothetical protein
MTTSNHIVSLKPLITIITAVFNGEKYLSQTIESVLNQTYPNIEYIIVDGKSQDSSVEIIEKYASRLAYWHSEKDTGIYDAWNKGLGKAKGEWIAFVGADDILYPEAIEKYVDFITNSRPFTFEYISSQIELVTNDLKLKRVKGSPWSWRVFRVYMNTAHVGSLHHYTLFKKYGLYNISYKITGDYELLLRAKGNLKAGFISDITVKMRTEDTLSMRSATLTQKETLRAKIETAGRNRLIAYYEMAVAVLKAQVRKALHI